MEILEIVKNSTPEQCREIGEIILSLADSPRDAEWHANLERVMARFRSPEEEGMAEQLNASRQRELARSAALRADGMDHRSLIEAELQRRGDPRSFEEYRDEIGVIHSDLDRA